MSPPTPETPLLVQELRARGSCDSDLRTCRENWPADLKSWCAGCVDAAAAEALEAVMTDILTEQERHCTECDHGVCGGQPCEACQGTGLSVKGLVEQLRQHAIPLNPTCAGCGGPHPFDTTVPSVVWNRVIRARGLPEYLCATCILRAFVLSGESFTAELISRELGRFPIEVIVHGEAATDAIEVSEENNRLRWQLHEQAATLAQIRRVLEQKAADWIIEADNLWHNRGQRGRVKAALVPGEEPTK